VFDEKRLPQEAIYKGIMENIEIVRRLQLEPEMRHGSDWMGNGSKKSKSNSAAGRILIGYSQGTERDRAALQIRRA
jgi:hypothetical protein